MFYKKKAKPIPNFGIILFFIKYGLRKWAPAARCSIHTLPTFYEIKFSYPQNMSTIKN